MTLPKSFEAFSKFKAKGGKFRRLLVASQGDDNTGKTEFMLSMPGPGIIIAPDPGTDGCLMNPEPPEMRQDDILVVPYTLLRNKEPNCSADDFISAWASALEFQYSALDNPDALSVGWDDDAGLYTLLRLAVHGRVEKVPSMAYAESDAYWYLMMDKRLRAGKNFVATYKLKDEYITETDPFGKVVKDDKGNPNKIKSGRRDRMGFRDHEYNWMVQLEHLFRKEDEQTTVAKFGPNKGKPVTIPAKMEWGFRVLRCKMSRGVEGAEVWGDACNFAGLIDLIYPGADLREWGYK